MARGRSSIPLPLDQFDRSQGAVEDRPGVVGRRDQHDAIGGECPVIEVLGRLPETGDSHLHLTDPQEMQRVAAIGHLADHLDPGMHPPQATQDAGEDVLARGGGAPDLESADDLTV